MGDCIEITTQSNLKYVFIPESSGALELEVKATNDAQIALTNGPFESDPMTEFIIGGWHNTKSIIKRDRRDPCKATTMATILNANEYVSIWVTWYNGWVSAGLKGSAAFITYKDPDPHPVNYVAVRSGWDAVASWKIKVSPLIFRTLPVKPIKNGDLRWVEKSPNEELPPDAFIGGYEDGEVLYVARAMHDGTGSLLPGKYLPRLKCAIVGTHMETHMKETCEILCGFNAAWVKTSHDHIPPHVFPGGSARENNGETLYIGRARLDNNLVPGKVHVSHKQCYVPYQGSEACVRENYEILVLPEKLPSAVVWRQQIQESEPNPRSRRREMEEIYRRHHRYVQRMGHHDPGMVFGDL